MTGRDGRVAIVGAGVTGLAAGMSSGAPVFEQSGGPGGICRSYYVRPGKQGSRRWVTGGGDGGGEAYRFEVGGGHWIFGGDESVLRLLDRLTTLTRHHRLAAVRLGSAGRTVPYPLQAHLEELSDLVAGESPNRGSNAATEPSVRGEPATLAEWLEDTFGRSLCGLFFFPFHERYTAGLYRSVAPQDGYKSPSAEVQRPLGYNAEFCYPEKGLDALTVAMAARCDVRYGKRVVGIDRARRVLCFADGTEHGYDVLISTLPLHLAVRLSDAEEEVGEPPDPYTSVLVLNIGAARGPSCPDSHWQYESDSRAGFHRVGFYSNVDTSFLPASTRAARTHVSMYVESAYGAGHAPTRGEVSRYSRLVVEELKQRGYIGRTEVVDPSFVECAYTWRRPGSRWVERSIEILGEMGILQVGRYGRWHFQGIAESVSEGLAIGERLAGRPVAEASVPRAPRRSTSCT